VEPGVVGRPPQLLEPPHSGGNISDEVTVVSSSSQPTSLARLGKQFLGLIAAVAVEKNWFEVV